jgi:hypothetical protein
METSFKKKQIERSFSKFQDSVSYVFRANSQTFPTFFDNLINFCETDEVMRVISSQLKQIDISYDKWYYQLKTYPNQKKEFHLPLDETKRAALIYKICIKIYTNEINVSDFCFKFFSTGTILDAALNIFNITILTPLVDSIGYKIQDISDTINEDYAGMINIPIAVLNVYHDNKVIIGSNNEFGGDTVIGRGLKLEKN